jgi:hypothetical protein
MTVNIDMLQKYLLEAAGKDKNTLPFENPYRDLAFDGNQARLGWVMLQPFSRIRSSLESIGSLLKDKDYFIFVGMGGSINGIKPLIALFNPVGYFTLDSLDPAALSLMLEAIPDLTKTLVVSISKSGTTKETQLLSQSMREVFSRKLGQGHWEKHFLWISDVCSFEKLDELGWEGIAKVSIQFDGATDIGGRFSSPHTFIFILPLFLLLGKDLTRLRRIYEAFNSLRADIQAQALCACKKHQDLRNAYFSPSVDTRFGVSFSSWIIQLFQESLGSKASGLEVKTFTDAGEDDKEFVSFVLDKPIDDPVVALMSQMYFFQLFVAFYSATKMLNFVNQEYVEKYKDQMRKLLDSQGPGLEISRIGTEALIKAISESARDRQRFIEVVLYFYPQGDIVQVLKQRLGREFVDKRVLVFIGSDWNHQSYQAAFGSSDTLYVFLTAASYCRKVPGISEPTLAKNIDTLTLIAKATYITLKSKALLFSLCT